MSRILDKEYEKDYYLYEDDENNLDDSDEYLYENMLKNLDCSTQEKKNKCLESDNNYKKVDFYEEMIVEDRKKIIQIKEKQGKPNSKDQKKSGLRGTKIRYSLGSGVLPHSLMSDQKLKAKKFIHMKSELGSKISPKKKNGLGTPKVQIEKKIKLSGNVYNSKKPDVNENSQKNKQEKNNKERMSEKTKISPLILKNNENSVKIKTDNTKDNIIQRKIKSKKKTNSKQKIRSPSQNAITNKEVWGHIDGMSKTSLTEFLKKLNRFYNLKFGNNNQFLTGSTLQNNTDFSINNNSHLEQKNDLDIIKKDLDDVKAYISDFKKQQNKVDVLSKIRNLADL
jgi:hypothetical protein